MGRSKPGRPPINVKATRKKSCSATEQAARQQLAEDKAKVEAVLARYPAGETPNMIEPAAGLSRKRTNAAIHALVEEGAVVAAKVEKDAGKSGARPYPGYKLAEPISDEDDEREEPKTTTMTWIDHRPRTSQIIFTTARKRGQIRRWNGHGSLARWHGSWAA